MSSPLFWSTPLKYCRWAAREKPALFWSVVIGAAGPLAMPIGPPIRRWLGDVDPAPVPVTYPGALFSSPASARLLAYGAEAGAPAIEICGRKHGSLTLYNQSLPAPVSN